MSVTIKDIARIANVSYSTVSKALNDSPLVQPKTKQKILKIANEMGYQPNIAAKRLVSNKSKTIGVVWPTINRVALSTIVMKLNEEIEKSSYSMILSVNKAEQAINKFKQYQVDGILAFEAFQEIRKLKLNSEIPIAFIAESLEGHFPSIDVRRKEAMFLAVKYLHALGHTRLAYVGQITDAQDGQFEKYIGFTEAIIRTGLNPRSDMFFNSEGLYYDHGYKAMKKVLQSEYKPTAIIAGSFEITQGIVRAAMEKGLSIPDDMSLIGYDNIPQMGELEIPVTAIGAPFDQIAKKSVETLFHYINTPDAEPCSQKVEPEIFERNSCKPLIPSK